MYKIKKTIKYILFIMITSFLLLPFISNNKVNASEVNNYEMNVDNFQNVDSLGYLYNFDGSADYIYVDFIDETGYVIFSEDTLEILEFTNTGSFPYDSTNEQKYYGGPYKYFVKINNVFKNVLTDEEFSFSTAYIEQVSSFSRSLFNTTKETNLEIDALTAKEKISTNYAINIFDYETNNIASSPLSPPLDENNWISPTSDATYIDNKEYFMTPSEAPRHGSNNGTSCTTVAIQLLLSYNNYYNDRRIIPPEYLFGEWKNGSSDVFNSSNYTTPDDNPNVCDNPSTITSEIIGSNQDFHDYLFSEQITGFLTDAQDGLEDYLDDRGISYDIECEMETTLPFDWGSVQTIDSAKITSKIDEGKPVVISTEESLNGTPYTTSSGTQRAFNHSVIAYGYQTLAPYTSSGNTNSYLGYIVHMGWNPSGSGWNTNIWTNSSWYYSYLSLDINHEHTYNTVINNIIDNSKIEIRCGECGHRTLDDLYVLSGNTIIDVKYDLIDEITIPSNINGIEVKGIGAEAFKNCRNLQEIIIPNSVTNIDSSAFENCSYLQSVTLSSNLVSIGSSAFKGCGSLASITIPNTVTNIDSSAFENCSYLQSVTLSSNLVSIGSSAFKGCGSLANITIPNSVTNIDSSAFENCSYLQSVTLSTNLNAIGVSAFKGCGSLGSITIPSNVQYIDDSAFENCVSLVSVVVEREISDITNLGNYAFAGCSSSLQITVPKNRVAEYKNKVYWSSYKNRIIADNDNFSEIELHCLSDFYNLTSLSVNYNKLYKLNVLCGKSYQITADSNSNVKINLYDSDMNLISSNVNSLITYLGVNTYYIDIELENESSSEIVTTTFALRWEHDGERIYYNDEHNLLTHLHQISDDNYFTKLYYINNNGAGFYKLQITGSTLNGTISSNELGTISIYNDSDRTINQLLTKYPNSNEYAISNDGQDTMYVYLPRNGYFYIDVFMPSDNYETLELTISPVESETINLLSSMTSTFTEDLTSYNNQEEYAKKIIVNQTSKYSVNINSSDALSNNFNIVMFKQTYSSSSNKYYTNFELIEFITNTSTQKTFEVSLDSGLYYIYYYGNDTNANIDLTLTRILQNNNDRTYAMQADPAGSGYSVGSEVRFNNGSRNNYTITEGFTRNLFFVLEDFYTYSRLDFDWYSSNENVATVSDFGTVFAKNVSSAQTVTIYAVYKEDPSLIYYRTFSVVDDTSDEQIVITCNMSYSYSEENGEYQIELQDNNSPYPWIQYYNWSVYVPCQETDITCSVNMWGEVTASGPGYATITGTYTINPRVTIIINLTITE